jgi:hypothetical protein
MIALALLLQIAPVIEVQQDWSAEAPAADPEGFPYISTTMDGDEIYARPESTRTSPGFPMRSNGTEMWFEIKHADGRLTKQLWRFLCEERRLTPLTTVKYDRNGRHISTWQNKDGVKFFTGEPVVPDTVGSKMLAFACDAER